MDNCYLCGKPIDEGIQYIVDHRRIHLGSKPWCATPGGHYALCDECDKELKLHIERVKSGCFPVGYYASRNATSIFIGGKEDENGT